MGQKKRSTSRAWSPASIRWPSRLIAHETAKARSAGFDKMTLDVADNNPRAEALYQRLGFTFVKQKQFKGRKNSDLPNARFMELPLEPR